MSNASPRWKRNPIAMSEKEAVYGFPCVENPNDFSPDYECCTEAEIAKWKEDCAAWDAGTYKGRIGCTTEFSEDGQMVKHITRTAWGIGVNMVDMDETG